MARNVWAKIWCDILRHPMLRRRPDSDVRLVLGLMLHAKEYSSDGVIRDLDAEEMRGLFGIKAPLATVKAGLVYLLQRGWLIEQPDGALRIRDFVERQGADTQTQRTQRWRAGVKLRRVGSSPVAALMGKVAERAARQESAKANEFNSESAWLEARYRERHNLPPPEPLPPEWEKEIRKELAG